ncbi:MAG: glucose-1-phosphate adenylyltransferase subunit GlgD [Clostridium sp.]|nr:glucose-1-phosphate adenylyltransferase subunit GlgD [Clostridium sp.]
MINSKLFGVINLSENDYYIRQLTYNRPIASIPFLGRYRLIDFTLSNLVNAGISTVGMFLDDRSRSLMDHITSGKVWNLDRKNGGIFWFLKNTSSRSNNNQRGDLNNYYDNLDYLLKAKGEYAVVTGTSMVSSVDYKDALENHIKNEADISIIYKTVDSSDSGFKRSDILHIDENKRVLNIGRNIKESIKSNESNNISMNMYIIKKDLLIDLITDSISSGENIFLADVFKSAVKDNKVIGYEYKGFLKNINSIKSYYNANMDMLDEQVLREVFFGKNKVRTKVKDEVPTYYSESSKVENSLIANGCNIEGEVINSILFRSVNVAKGSIIKDSIIMQSGDIRENVTLENVITDKKVVITKGTSLKGDKENPLVIKKNTIL